VELTLDHIHIRCHDLEAAVDYYVKVLGGEVEKRTSVPGMPIVRVRLGGQTIALSPKRQEMEVESLSGAPRWGVWQLAYRVDDIQAVYQELKARGAKFKGEPVEQVPGLTVAFVEAPDGVEIELLQFS